MVCVLSTATQTWPGSPSVSRHRGLKDTRRSGRSAGSSATQLTCSFTSPLSHPCSSRSLKGLHGSCNALSGIPALSSQLHWDKGGLGGLHPKLMLRCPPPSITCRQRVSIAPSSEGMESKLYCPLTTSTYYDYIVQVVVL